ncbi:MAG: RNA-binding protein 42 [Chrysothrix sp. TS-e1954]|nr:MAG: RNA-binding protein 42 [Chrysothrix sp. TS-e1954]
MSGAPRTSSSAGFAFRPRSVPNKPNAPAPTPTSQYSYNTNYGAGSYNEQSYYQQPSAPEYSHQSTPRIENPFPEPGQPGSGGGSSRFGGGSYDPEQEAQIAQWNSAYLSKEDTSHGRNSGVGGGGNPNLVALGMRGGNASDSNTRTNGAPAARPEPAQNDGATSQQEMTVMREGGGKTWQDDSLLEWNPAHFRLFVGNLAGEVTDQALRQGFAAYPSLERTKVVREKRTTKSTGFGFVSFSDGGDYFRAFKDMNGKYIGSHPIKLEKSNTHIQAVAAPSKDDRRYGKGNKGRKPGAGGHADTGAGVQKRKQTRTKEGLKILG